MEFTKLVPKNNRVSGVSTTDKIRVAFPKIAGRINAVIYIGELVAKRIGFGEKDKISVAFNEANPFILFIKKDTVGWTLNDISKSKSSTRVQPLFRLQLAWPKEVPETMQDGTMRFVDYDMFMGGIRLFLPGSTMEDRSI